ncbi:aromatic ring-hydroxylating dioxygenase subunit alpha [Paraburkholderia sp. SG-MS1]|uniref:aromatic ring-hydroxylating dioxygenase subunit alpha n=1 Tax=Paraburkholderia sp. SG-MS1 TaxID=2023741 RepID=UPI0014450D32|nr:aromatic ring-hydroxylating dioxygenase subunit alpha [Paraburkholderia sp. SG-MS1]
MYLRNCWYVAAWNYEIEADTLLARTIINEPLVFFRKEDGTVAALQDRCCHRSAPLSIGRKEGDAVRCMYHGLKFDSSGKCVEIPGQDAIPPQACVRSFPVTERYSWVWVWMGDPALADENLIPPAVAHDDPNWIFRSGSIEYAANYQLVNDNLLDFSHLTFLHPNSFGVGSDWAHIRPKVTRLERGVRVERWLPNQPIPNHIRGVTDCELLDLWSHYDYLVPGVMVMYSSSYPQGTLDKFNGGAPTGIQPITSDVTCQAITPCGDEQSRYFFSWAPNVHAQAGCSDELADGMIAIARMAFEEDRLMIESQAHNLKMAPNAKQVAIAFDNALSQMRWVLDKLIKEEAQPQLNSASVVA